MPPGPVSPPLADKGMVSINVHELATSRALKTVCIKGNPQSSTKHDAEKVACCPPVLVRWESNDPGSRAVRSAQVEVRLEEARVALERCAIGGRRLLYPPERGERGAEQVM